MDRISELEKQLEQEREKVKGLEAQMGERFKYHELFKKWQAWRDPDELVAEYEKYEAAQTQLSQLQALVRAISETMEPFRKSLAKLDEVDTLATRRIAEADAYYCAQRALATLDATTPAVCPDCDGDGAVDSGGTDPNGNPLTRRCGCREKGGDGE